MEMMTIFPYLLRIKTSTHLVCNPAIDSTYYFWRFQYIYIMVGKMVSLAIIEPYPINAISVFVHGDNLLSLWLAFN